MINSFKEMHLKRDENKINIIKKINKFLYLISSSKFGISIIKKNIYKTNQNHEKK